MLLQIRDYDELYRSFRWQVPAQFNIGVEVCDRWAERDPGRLAIVAARPDGQADNVSYGWLRETSNRLANALVESGNRRRFWMQCRADNIVRNQALYEKWAEAGLDLCRGRLHVRHGSRAPKRDPPRGGHRW